MSVDQKTQKKCKEKLIQGAIHRTYKGFVTFKSV